MKLSIVTTLYKSSPYIDEFYARISREAQNITDDYEIIFVDDGSPDDSLSKAVALYEKDSKVKVIELSRNFGHHKAIMTGLSHAKGEFIFLIDSDLEEDPELLGKFWEELHKEKDIDVVFGVQESRKGRWFEKATGSLFWKVFNKLSDIRISENPLTIRIMNKKFIENLIKFKERELFLAGIFELVGFNQRSIIVYKKSKQCTTYSLFHKLKLLNNAVVSFSSFPLYLSFYIGLLVVSFSFVYALYLVLNKILFNLATSGWTSLMVSIWFLNGVLLISIGILGLYVSKIFQEIKNRPIVEKNVYGGDRNE